MKEVVREREGKRNERKDGREWEEKIKGERELERKGEGRRYIPGEDAVHTQCLTDSRQPIILNVVAAEVQSGEGSVGP